MTRADDRTSSTLDPNPRTDTGDLAVRTVAAPLWLAMTVGVTTIVFTVAYLASDIIEVGQGHFSTLRLALTYAGEAAIPLFVLGLYALQRPHIGRLGLFGAAAYAYAYVFFTSTVDYALVTHTRDYQGVTRAFGPWMVIHGLIMVIGGVCFGLAVVRARVLPRWSGICLAAGAVVVAGASALSTVVRTFAEAVPAAAFIGMGCALLRGSNRAHR
jgi:hypothetical protein